MGIRLAALPLLLLLWACSAATVASFPWLDEEGQRLPFVAEGGAVKGEEGLLSAASPRTFRLLEAARIEAASSLFLDLRPKGPAGALAVDIKSGGAGAVLLHFEVAVGAPEQSIALPLEAGFPVSAIVLSLLPAGGRNPGEVEIAAIRFGPAFRGFDGREGAARLSPSFSLRRKGASFTARLEAPFEGLGPRAGTQPAFRLAWGEGPRAILEIGAGPDQSASVDTRGSPGSLLVPRSWFGASLPWIEVSGPVSTTLEACFAGAVADSELSALDLGVIVSLPPEPGKDFVVRRWDQRPEVLVLDFADYAAQDRALKRLAFFVEKKGYKGRLAPDSEIAALHGWNAHDYRADDLARFFSKAKRESFQLGASELEVRSLLLASGVIAEEGDGYAGRGGALISVARESPSWLRYTFIAHEASHALYFTDPDFRDFVRASWAGVGADERWFWKLYFGWMNYDTANDDLMATEFMSYLYQQPVAKVGEYFTKTLPARLLEGHPELAPRIEAYMGRYGASFEAHAAAIEAWIRARYGFEAGRPYSFRP